MLNSDVLSIVEGSRGELSEGPTSWTSNVSMRYQYLEDESSQKRYRSFTVVEVEEPHG